MFGRGNQFQEFHNLNFREEFVSTNKELKGFGKHQELSPIVLKQ